MKQIDLDDLPPRAAQILAGLAAGEARAAEIFEHFRSLMEDDF